MSLKQLTSGEGRLNGVQHGHKMQRPPLFQSKPLNPYTHFQHCIRIFAEFYQFVRFLCIMLIIITIIIIVAIMILVRTGECQSITTRQSKIVGMEGKFVRQSNITQYIEFEITNGLCICVCLLTEKLAETVAHLIQKNHVWHMHMHAGSKRLAKTDVAIKLIFAYLKYALHTK